jgi:HKD family nuclease
MISRELRNTILLDNVIEYIEKYRHEFTRDYFNEIVDTFINYCEDSTISIDDLYDNLRNLDLSGETLSDLIDLIKS